MLARLEIATYRARVERAVVLSVEALDWNCPQHITPRFSEDEVAEMTALLQRRVVALETALAQAPSGQPGPAAALGDGSLELAITGIRQLTLEVRTYELRRPDFADLPAVTAGSHIQVPVPREDATADSGPETRTYSISSNPSRRDAYEIAVRLDPAGSGGSRTIHERYALGQVIRAGLPRNAFALHDDARPAELIAGGIGITPLKAMAQTMLAEGRPFHLHFAARSLAHMAYRTKLQAALGGAVTFYVGGAVTFYVGDAGKRLDVAALITASPDDAVFYVCGPERLIEAVRSAADRLGIAADRVRLERFSKPAPRTGDRAFRVRLARSGRAITVAADETLLDALIDAGAEADYACKTGTCGTCAVKVLEGDPVHRDQALSPAERDRAALMCACVSRARGDSLVLDL